MPSDPLSFDEIKLPFIFVPHGAPEPTEWLQRHPDYIKLPATFVPRARSDGRGAADGLRAPSDPAAPWLPAGDALSNGMSAEASGASDGVSLPDDPIAAFRQANDALATAASGYASDRAGGSNQYAAGLNNSKNGTDPSGMLRAYDAYSAASKVSGAVVFFALVLGQPEIAIPFAAFGAVMSAGANLGPELLAQCKPENRPDPIDFGPPVGREMI
jgi:hypothetical protein